MAWTYRLCHVGLVVLLMATGLAGCLGPSDRPAGDEGEPQRMLPMPGSGIIEANLSQEVHAMAERFVAYATMDDGVKSYVEVYLPEGEGPWPAILEVSPYNQFRAADTFGSDAGIEEARTGLAERYVPRGYAVAHAHLRGTGNSEGCIDMMGPRETKDTHDLVEWVAAQPWSDGKVGMHGVSYVGTTPHMAAITAPEHLVTIVTIAGVTNQWRNVYMNGVPYQGRAYPLVYEAYNGLAPATHATAGPDWATAVASGAACVNQDAIEAMRPGVYEKGLYTDYWNERNLTLGVQDANASMLYSQGFIDRAVNPIEAVGWYNEYPAPKKAFFHQGGHMYPPRDDYFTVELAWFDHWLKGIETGVMDAPPVEVITNEDTIRVADEWPPAAPAHHDLYLSPGALVAEAPADASETYIADQWRNVALGDELFDLPTNPPAELRYTSSPLEERLYMAGQARFHLQASVDAENTFFMTDLWEVDGDEWTWITEGWMNAHLRDGFDRSSPLTPGATHGFDFSFEPREWVFEQGKRIGLSIRGHDDRVGPIDEASTINTVYYGDEGSWIRLPVLEHPEEHERPEHV